MSDISSETLKLVDLYQPGDRITRAGVDEVIASITVPVDREIAALQGRYATVFTNEAGLIATSTFYWFDYIDPTQLDLIKNHDIASQNESLVIQGVQAMMNDAMAFVQGGSKRVAKVVCEGGFAINDEIFSEGFAESLWNLTSPDVDFIFAGDARFHAKNWPAATRPRASGFYADRAITVAVPTVMFRWMQRAKYGFSPKIVDWWFIGEGDIGTDPIGLMARNINLFDFNVNVEACAQGGIHISDMNNGSSGNGLVGEVSRCGANITGAGGTGFLPEDVRAALTPGSGTSSLSIVSLDGGAYAGSFEFLPEHVGRVVIVTHVGVNNEDFTARILSVDSSTSVTLSRQATSACSGNIFSFGYMPVDTVAGSPNIMLPPNMTLNLTGRFVGIIGAGSSLHLELDTPYVRVVSHDQPTGAVVLARPCRNTVTDAALITGPAVFIGKDEDQVQVDGVTPETGHPNDVRVNLRIENGDNHYSTVPMFAQNILATQFQGTKWHGIPSKHDNFGGNFCSLILDNCKFMQTVGCQLEWGIYCDKYAKVVVTGARNHVLFDGLQVGDFETNDTAAIFYTDPQSPGRANCVIQISDGGMNAPNFPSANQTLVRNGPNGLLEHVQGTIRRRNDGGALDLTEVFNKLEITNFTPSITFTDENDGKQFRIKANGSEICVDFSQDGDGIFDARVLSWTATDGFHVGEGDVLFTPTLLIGGVDIATQGGAYVTREGSFYRAFGRAFVSVEIEISAKGTGTGAVSIGVPEVIRPKEYNDPLPGGWFDGFNPNTLAGNVFGATVGQSNDQIVLRAVGPGGSGFVGITHASIADDMRVKLVGNYQL